MLLLVLVGCAQVLFIIVIKVVVGHNGEQLDTDIHEELGKHHGLGLYLARLEIVTTNKELLTLGELDDIMDKCILINGVPSKIEAMVRTVEGNTLLLLVLLVLEWEVWMEGRRLSAVLFTPEMMPL